MLWRNSTQILYHSNNSFIFLPVFFVFGLLFRSPLQCGNCSSLCFPGNGYMIQFRKLRPERGDTYSSAAVKIGARVGLQTSQKQSRPSGRKFLMTDLKHFGGSDLGLQNQQAAGWNSARCPRAKQSASRLALRWDKGSNSREMKLIPSILSARTWSRQVTGLGMPYRWKQGLGLEMVFEQARNSRCSTSEAVEWLF